MKLISNWRRAHRMLSVQAMAMAGAVQGAWAATPDDLKSGIPANWVHWLCLALLVLGIAGRLVDQGSTKP